MQNKPLRVSRQQRCHQRQRNREHLLINPNGSSATPLTKRGTGSADFALHERSIAF